jgi:hypothetical protein
MLVSSQDKIYRGNKEVNLCVRYDVVDLSIYDDPV